MGSMNMGPTYTSSHCRWPTMRREGGAVVGTSRARWGRLRAVPDGPCDSLDPKVACHVGNWSGAGPYATVPDGPMTVVGGGEGG
jgi:hypothetical protein